MEETLFGAEDGHAALVEVMRVFFGGDVEVDGEDEVGASEVEIHGQRDLQTRTQREKHCESGRKQKIRAVLGVPRD